MEKLIFDDDYALLHNVLFLGKLAYSGIAVFERMLVHKADREEDHRWMAEMTARAGRMPEDLCCFFRVYADEQNPLKTIFFRQFIDGYKKNRNYDNIYNYFRKCSADPVKTRNGLLRFYLPKLKRDGESWNDVTPERIMDGIHALNIRNDIKLSLLGFIYDPQSGCVKLGRLLDSLTDSARALHAKNTDAVEATKKRFAEDKVFYNRICNILAGYSPENYRTVYVGVASLNRYELYGVEKSADELILEIGVNIAETLNSLETPQIDIPMLGKLLSEPKRVEALRLLRKHDCYSGELAVATDTTDSTMSYHMGICSNVGIVRMFTVGRKTYYKLNREYLVSLGVLIDEMIGDIDSSRKQKPDK